MWVPALARLCVCPGIGTGVKESACTLACVCMCPRTFVQNGTTLSLEEKRQRCVSNTHARDIRQRCVSVTQTDDIQQRCVNVTQADDIRQKCVSVTQADEIQQRCVSVTG